MWRFIVQRVKYLQTEKLLFKTETFFARRVFENNSLKMVAVKYTYTLELHTKTHTGEIPYKYEVCLEMVHQ